MAVQELPFRRGGLLPLHQMTQRPQSIGAVLVRDVTRFFQGSAGMPLG